MFDPSSKLLNKRNTFPGTAQIAHASNQRFHLRATPHKELHDLIVCGPTDFAEEIPTIMKF
jgi:hypothetical protein